MSSPLSNWISRLAGRNVLVIGDVILDEYLIGSATRMSREAPIPVIELETRRLIPGGAANPAANIVSLGSTAQQIGIIGEDSTAKQLCDVLQTVGIETSGLIADGSRPTTVKSRIMAQMDLRFPQQLARLDTLSREPISALVEQRIYEAIEQRVTSAEVVLLSDYHIGLLTPSLVDRVRSMAQARNLPLTADAQGYLDKYHGLTVVKCNADEASRYLRRALHGDKAFAEAAVELRQRLHLTGAMVITRGADGATLATADDQTHHCPAPQVTDVYDTVGAGDTAIAVLTLAVAGGTREGEGMPYPDAVMLANYASGLVVRRVGNYAPSLDELRAVVEEGF
jgi:rfaE bifunctional protein kinase chain/domain